MEYQSENRTCQNCKNDFTIEPDDFSFYEKIKVPPPTFCSECRMIRRMMWRNERSLYKRNCSLCNKGFISMYSEETPFPVFCRDCWWGDGWDAKDYAIDLDFTKPFFTQLKELFSTASKLGIFQRNVINSDYTNMVGESKNIYLSTSVVADCENVYFSKSIDKSKNIFDSYSVKECDTCYENIECEKNFNSHYMHSSKNCLDSFFLYDCSNCSNCFMSSSLRNKQYVFLNRQLTKEEYFNNLSQIDLGSREIIYTLKKEFDNLRINTITRFAKINKSVNSFGDNLSNVKDCKSCFNVYDAENLKHCYRVFSNMKDSMDCDFAVKSELLYEYTTGALNCFNLKFSYSGMNSVSDSEYTDSCINSKYLFGCIGIKNSNYCILNKQYSKEEYFEMVEKIKKHMNDMPYIDSKGRIFKYGEFFSPEFSSFSYNETTAQEFFPLTKEEIIDKGYLYKKREKRNILNMVDLSLIDNISSFNESFFNEVFSCEHKGECSHQCTEGFKLTIEEVSFYKKIKIPLPIMCPNCRHFDRLSKINPLKLWHRQCMKEGCSNEFETSYAPNRSEIVYCEKCYQQEVY